MNKVIPQGNVQYGAGVVTPQFTLGVLPPSNMAQNTPQYGAQQPPLYGSAQPQQQFPDMHVQQQPYINAFPISTNEINVKEFLASKRWPAGLQNTLLRGLPRNPIRYIIIDDSGSRAAGDGQMAQVSSKNLKLFEINSCCLLLLAFE